MRCFPLACALAALASLAAASIAPREAELSLRRLHRRAGAACKVTSRNAIDASTAKSAPQQVSAAKQVQRKHRKHSRKHRKSSKKAPVKKPSSQKSSSFADAVPADLSAVAFQGQQGPGIASWYDSDTGRDSTNGHSWCGFPYNDNSRLFAPSVGTMLRKYGGNYEAAAKAHCGMIARVKHPNGKVVELVIGDGFDDRWVRKPGSIDIMHNAFNAFNGQATEDKIVVVQGVTWTLTGQRSQQYAFKGRGN